MSRSASTTDSTSRDHPSLLKARPLAAVKSCIVCGTDFSPHAAQAVEAATAFAQRLHEPLVLAHAVDEEARASLPEDLRESLCVYERAQLHDELADLRTAHVEVIEHFRAGIPDAVLVESAAAHGARLVVLSSHGRKPPGRWVLGSVAERTAERSPVPTLIVRSAAPFVRWARGERNLRIFVAADFSTCSDAALRWVQWLQAVGRCDVVVAYLEPPPPVDGAHLYPSPTVAKLLVESERAQSRCFRQRVRAVLGASRVRIRFEKGWGRSDAHLIQMAREDRADLIVVGTHQRRGLARLGHLSVSRGLLHYAPMSVACVPPSSAIN
jgi:nucleotide-binding universal stress UspA family protein